MKKKSIIVFKNNTQDSKHRLYITQKDTFLFIMSIVLFATILVEFKLSTN